MKLPAAVVFSILILCVPANATVVNFDQLGDIEPIDVLQIGDITAIPSGPISSSKYIGSAPAVVSGEGLGSSLLGPSSSFDWVAVFEAGSHTPILDIRESLKLTVNGIVNSITIEFYALVAGVETNQISIPIEMRWMYDDQWTWWTWAFEPGAPNVATLVRNYVDELIQNPDTILLISRDEGASQDFEVFHDYLEANGMPDATFQISFTVKSIDYTPYRVPEPSPMPIFLTFILAGALMNSIFQRTKVS